jgi:hypothetical protein
MKSTWFPFKNLLISRPGSKMRKALLVPKTYLKIAHDLKAFMEQDMPQMPWVVNLLIECNILYARQKGAASATGCMTSFLQDIINKYGILFQYQIA